MSDMDSVDEGSGARRKSSSARERELYRYFHPPPGNASSPVAAGTDLRPSTSHGVKTKHLSPEPHPQLAALAQLTAIRLDASRAVVRQVSIHASRTSQSILTCVDHDSVLDCTRQYFLAEATKSIRLDDLTQYECEGDELYFDCRSSYAIGRLCERALGLPCETRPQCLIIEDLQKGSEYQDLDIVNKPPFFRYYASVPIATKRRIHIGTLFILDTRPRPRLTHDQQEFLAHMARLVMNFFEMDTEAENLKKLTRMNAGLNAFVEGRIRTTANDIKRLRRGKRSLTDDTGVDSVEIDRESNVSPTSNAKARKSDEKNISTSDASSASTDVEESPLDDTSHQAVLLRAAKILFRSLNGRQRPQTGGVVYFDATSRIRQQSYSHLPSITFSMKAAQTIAQVAPEKSFFPPDESYLQTLLHKYPQGKLWSFDPDEGAEASSDDNEATTRLFDRFGPGTLGRSSSRQQEAELLQRHFPGSRQLMFNGLWDLNSCRWLFGVFAWTTSQHQIFSTQGELTFFRAFGNAVMAEISRQASIASDQQKSAFISSTSHELRSPLHGILASAEFLCETELTPFQSSLVDIIASCGRTLNDTMTHILDYSKINSFEKAWQQARKSSAKRGSVASVNASNKVMGPPILHVRGLVNVAAVAEEVIEGVFAGQIYQDIRSDDRGHVVDLSQIPGRQRPGPSKDVNIILDFQHGDYTFYTQPGAFRRIIMNIFGNALKYTTNGNIVISMRLEADSADASDDAQEGQMLRIKVTDTGKGITREYLRTKLYTPFAQEDTLASGTGLGLSIVRSICNVLRGDVDVQSELGEGTEVTIRLPMERRSAISPTLSDRRSNSEDGLNDTLINRLRQRQQHTKVCLYGFGRGDDIHKRALQTCIEGWYGMQTAAEPLDASFHLAIVDEKTIETCSEVYDIPTILLCGIGYTLRDRIASCSNGPRVLEFLTKPYGPYKLARTIQTCLNRAEELPPRQTTNLKRSEKLPSNEDAGAAFRKIEPTSAKVASSTLPTATSWVTELSDDGGALNVPRASVEEASPPLMFPMELSKRLPTAAAPDIHQIAPFVPVEEIAPGPKQVMPHSLQPIPAQEQAHIFSSSESAPTSPPINQPFQPRLLLVDDNIINLRLLQTFMSRRKYTNVDVAENGLLAVQAAEKGYNIIFMDISMPIMNGFEATRAIRDLERAQTASGTPVKAPALIVALTGVASGDDQQQAMAAGVNRFMTKTVSFKEVGKLLDDWIKEHDEGS